MRSLTYFALALPALVAAKDKLAKRGVGDMVVATIDGQVVSWANAWAGPGAAAASPPPQNNVVQPTSAPPVQAPTTTTPAYQPPPTTANGGGQSTTAVPLPVPTTPSSSVAAPVSTGGGGASTGSSCADGQQSIELTNNSGKDLHIIAAAPWVVGPCEVIAAGSTCTFCQDRGNTGGNLQVGYGMKNGRATWLEGNWDIDAQFPCMDVSYIPGYSVPITCTGSDGTSTIGMADSLCADENCSNCGPGGGTYQDGVCLNPMGDPLTVLVDGPAPEFFSSATGIVYTYPHDDHVGFTSVWDKATCIAHPQHGNGSSKRAVEAPQVEAKSKRESHAHSHVGKKHRRHQHRHAVQEGSKL